jgi:aspartate/methionine/tyrosine aminotransferase
MAQEAGVQALRSAEAAEEVRRMVHTYDRRRRYLIWRLKNMGLGLTVEPTGAFYALANAKAFDHDSYRLAFDILANAKVGVTPGVDFGGNAEGYLRFSYANSLENIAEGMDRLERYLHDRQAD